MAVDAFLGSPLPWRSDGGESPLGVGVLGRTCTIDTYRHTHRLPCSNTPAPEYDAALDAVCRRLNVNIEHSHANDECPSAPGLAVNDNNQALWEGAKAVGMQCLPLPRNVKGCRDCCACERGCPYGGACVHHQARGGDRRTHTYSHLNPPPFLVAHTPLQQTHTAKQSTLATFLEDAQATKKLRLVARAHVDKVWCGRFLRSHGCGQAH